MGRNEEVPLYEESEDGEEKITVEVDEYGHLDGVVATSSVIESFEENHDGDEAEDDSRLFRLLDRFCTHTTRAWTRT